MSGKILKRERWSQDVRAEGKQHDNPIFGFFGWGSLVSLVSLLIVRVTLLLSFYSLFFWVFWFGFGFWFSLVSFQTPSHSERMLVKRWSLMSKQKGKSETIWGRACQSLCLTCFSSALFCVCVCVLCLLLLLLSAIVESPGVGLWFLPAWLSSFIVCFLTQFSFSFISLSSSPPPPPPPPSSSQAHDCWSCSSFYFSLCRTGPMKSSTAWPCHILSFFLASRLRLSSNQCRNHP